MTISDYSDVINKMFEFWRFLRINESMLLQTAEVGDIILCFGKKRYNLKNRSNAIVEVCLIVKLDEEEDAFAATKTIGKKAKQSLYVIRVGSSRQGVILQNWDQFRLLKQARYHECQHRHLHCKRNDEFLQKTQIFI